MKHGDGAIMNILTKTDHFLIVKLENVKKNDLNSKWSVSTTEITAIIEAINYATTVYSPKLIVVFDCRSAPQELKKYSNLLTYRAWIIRRIYEIHH